MSSHLPTNKVIKTNAELLQDILKSVHSIHKRMDTFEKNLNNLKEDIKTTKTNIIDLNYRLPERKDGYLWGGSWVNT